MRQTIQHMVVIPKTKRSGVFYINGNFQDGHYKEYDDLYLFIAEKLHPPATIQVHDLIRIHEPFVVDFTQNYVEHLTFDNAAELEQLKTNIKTNVVKRVIKDLRRKIKEQEEKINIPHQRALDFLMYKTLSLDVTKQKVQQSNEIIRREKDTGPIIHDHL